MVLRVPKIGKVVRDSVTPSAEPCAAELSSLQCQAASPAQSHTGVCGTYNMNHPLESRTPLAI